MAEGLAGAVRINAQAGGSGGGDAAPIQEGILRHLPKPLPIIMHSVHAIAKGKARLI